MKLSDKGKRKILDNRYWFSEEFDQSDFQGVVCLTVEEAKVINKLVYMASCAFILTNEQLDAEEMLEKRIEQAEMSKQST